jgi:hypothetical protein
MASIIWPDTNPVKMTKKNLSTTDNIFLYDKYNHEYTVQDFEGGAIYNQKWVKGDQINLQAWGNDVQNVSIDMVDCHGMVINNYPATNAIPAFLINGITYDILTWSIDTTLFTEQEFYFILKFSPSTSTNVEQFMSERQESVASLVPSLLIEYYHRVNEFNTIFTTTYASTFSQKFYFRVEGRIEKVKQDALKKSYEDQRLNLTQQSSKPFDTFYFKIGGAKGIPTWAGSLLNMIMSCSHNILDGQRFTFIEKLDQKDTAYYKLYSYEIVARKTEIEYAKVFNVCAPAFNPNLVGTFVMPDAYVGIPYNYTYQLAGSFPLYFVGGATTQAVTSWLTASINASGLLSFTGTPAIGDLATNINIQVNITNDCGGLPLQIAAFDTIDVLNNAACVALSFTVPFTNFPDAVLNTPYSYQIALSGSLPFSIGTINANDVGATLTPNSLGVLVSGNLISNGVFNFGFVNFDVTNCGGNNVINVNGNIIVP